jgi:2'-5' RNA ligase
LPFTGSYAIVIMKFEVPLIFISEYNRVKMDKAVIRAFIAIDLPDDLQQKIEDITRQLQSQIRSSAVRWVPSRNIHLTLKFLGEVSPTNLELVKKIMRAEAERHHPFEVKVGTLGAFPTVRRPRVIWIGVDAPPDLIALQKGIESETLRLGYTTEDRPFSPHLTLARFSHNGMPDEVRTVGDVLASTKVGSLCSFTANQFHLFSSDLQPGGAVYTRLFSVPLGSRPPA